LLRLFSEIAIIASISGDDEAACLMTFRAERRKRNRWERVAARSAAARVGSRYCGPFDGSS
jgi:hypothetical protein